jgi:hypothetical protein
VQLLGDLLYRISGVSGKMSTETADEDDNFGTEQSHHVSRYSSINFIPVRSSGNVNGRTNIVHVCFLCQKL